MFKALWLTQVWSELVWEATHVWYARLEVEEFCTSSSKAAKNWKAKCIDTEGGWEATDIGATGMLLWQNKLDFSFTRG